MCGLVGVISKNTFGVFKKDVNIFAQMLFIDQLRGSDGTGIFYNRDKKDKSLVTIIKTALPSSEFLRQEKVTNALGEICKQAAFAIGHNRAATKGSITTACSHPFREKHITLVHNGTLYHHKGLTEEEVVVDSHAICKHIARNGYKETLKTIEGAFALIWYNNEENLLYFCRNNQRPLYLIETAFLYILCSEEGLGKWILSRNEETVISSKLLTPETVYTIDIDNPQKIKEEQVTYHQPIVRNYKNVYTVGGYNKNFGYSVGDTIKAKANCISFCHGWALYANSLINKTVPLANRTTINYEKEDDIIIYGNMEQLKVIQNYENLVGKITRIVWNGGKRYYLLENVTEEQEEKLIEGVCKKVELCEFCNNPFKEHEERFTVDTFTICKECTDMYYGQGQYYA